MDPERRKEVRGGVKKETKLGVEAPMVQNSLMLGHLIIHFPTSSKVTKEVTKDQRSSAE